MNQYIYTVDFKSYSMEEINKLTLKQLQKLIDDNKIIVNKLTPKQALYWAYYSCP